MRVVVAAATDIGQVRDGNEDTYVVEEPLFALADGMGGHRGGEVASRIAIETLERLFATGEGTLPEIVREANRAVFERSMSDRSVSGMGTTLTAAVLEGDHVRLAHVGDSRAYLLRDGALRRLTIDHTLVDRMVRSGEITAAEADVHPHKNVLTRALGTDQEVDVDERSVTLEEGDRLLLCSDGLTGMVTEDQIQAILEASPAPQSAAERLVRAANRAGGVDNISVVVLAATGAGGAAGGGRRPRRAAGLDRRTVARWGLRIAIPLLVIVVLLFGARWYLDRQWYVAPSDGSVAIFQGVPLTIVGYDLGRPVERFAELSAEEIRRLEPYTTSFDVGISAADREDAERIVAQMEEDLLEARREGRLDRELEAGQ